MSSPCGPEHAPAGDVGAALMLVDSRLKAIYETRTGTDPEEQQLVDQFTASMDSAEFDALVDGACTLMYMFTQWLRRACEDHDEDLIEYLVPSLVTTMRMMPKTFRPEVIPTMAGMVIAAGTGLSPSLWREQYGDWTQAEMNPLEATVVLLAERINRITDDHDFATRLIAEALSRADQR